VNRRKFIKSTLSGIPLLSSRPFFLRNQADPIHSNGSSVDQKRKRVRELGIIIGDLEPGPLNAITDVEGVGVGHTTISEGEGKGAVRTGVTVILPNNGRIMEENLYAAYFSLNGWGEMTGIAPIEETGKLATPIFLTGTYNVGIVYSAAVDYLKRKNSNRPGSERMCCPVVAECFDDFLSDTPKRLITEKDVIKAIENAGYGPVEEGAVGGGTGMTSFGFKGGIGTSSRVVSLGNDKFVVGVCVMANTANRKELRIDGVPVGKEIKGFEIETGKTKSIILIAATTAPLLPFQLKKIAKRVALGLAQTGAISHTGSGDIILAFSTGTQIPTAQTGSFRTIKSLNDFWISPLYQGTVEATQEAIINALTAAQTVVGKDGNKAYGIPLDQVKRIMTKYHRVKNVYFE
jgi:D-aminopeptidase